MTIFTKNDFLNFDQGCGDGAGAGAGAGKIGSAPAPKRDTVVARKQNNSEITRNSRTNSLRKFFINDLRTSAINYLKFS